MAERKLPPLFTLLKKILFRIAFAGYILLQVVALVLLLWAISEIVPDGNYFIVATLVALAFFGPFLIGAGSYLVFRRMTREDYLHAESERWVAQRWQPNPRRQKKIKTIKRWALWIPIATVVLVCVFFDEAWAFASHGLHPHSGRLIGYQVSIPLNWMVSFSRPYENEAGTWSFVASYKTNGLLRGGVDLLLGRKVFPSISEMAFYGAAGDQLETTQHSPFGRDRLIASRPSAFGQEEIRCSDYTPGYQHDGNYREVACSTPKGDFSCFFGGDEKDIQQFYQTLEAVRPTH